MTIGEVQKPFAYDAGMEPLGTGIATLALFVAMVVMANWMAQDR